MSSRANSIVRPISLCFQKYHLKLTLGGPFRLLRLLLKSIQLPRQAKRVTASKLPISTIPHSDHILHPPLHRRRHGRPTSPHTILGQAVKVHEEEGNNIRHASLGDGLLAPGFEDGGGGNVFGRALGRCRWMRGKGGNGADLVVEVVLEMLDEQYLGSLHWLLRHAY